MTGYLGGLLLFIALVVASASTALAPLTHLV